MQMRLGAFFIALFGVFFGLFNAYQQFSGFGEHVQYGNMWITIAASLLGGIGGGLVLMRFKYAPWILLIAAIGGVFPNLLLWEGAGSFFLVAAFIAFTTKRT